MNRLLDESVAVTSRLTEAEVSSAIARRVREGDLGREDGSSAIRSLRIDLTRIHAIEIHPTVVAAVHALLGRDPLRAGDALHLASALAMRDAGEEAVDFVGYDARLLEAARIEGFAVLP